MRPDQLKGKLIASFPGPTAKIYGPLALEKLGLPPGSYRIQEMDIGAHIAALESRQVDAAITYEPVATEAVESYGARRLVPGLVENQLMNPWQAGIWVISTSELKQNPDVSDAFF